MNHTEIMGDDDNGGYVSQFGPTNNGWFLLASFAIVASYLSLCSEGLNILEMFTLGTSYHLMIQRIYRELMMVGLTSFVFTILNQTSTTLSSKFFDAFAFSDILCFVMALFFCFQGVFIMLGSVGQAQNWNIAANISSEELNVNVDSAKEQLNWKLRYWPRCVTRDQVEFRILRSIFTSAYGISTKLGDLDFGMFLRATHEANILTIIDISFWKWCIVLVVIFVLAALESFYAQEIRCMSSLVTSCDSTYIVLLFTSLGFINTCLATLLWYWGRSSEIRLFKSCGVNGIDDYTVFLLTEDHAMELVDTNSVGNRDVRHTIAELMAEQKHLKIQKDIIAQKKKKFSVTKSFRHVKSRMKLKSAASVGSMLSDESSAETSSPKLAEAFPRGNPRGKIAIKTMSSEMSEQEDVENLSESSDVDRMDKVLEFSESRDSGDRTTSTAAISALTATTANTIKPSDIVRDFSKEEEEKGQEESPGSKDQIPNSSGSGESAGLRVPVSDSPLEDAFPLAGLQNGGLVTQRKRQRGAVLVKKFSSGASFRESINEIINDDKRKSKYKGDIHVTFKNRLKRNFNQQNFRSVFLFGAPELFYDTIGFVITCNSLYLAWWSTHVSTLAWDTQFEPFFVLVISLLPALCTFPVLALAIRSSSVLKAITYLNLDIVGEVMDKSSANAASLEEFRTDFLKVCSSRNIRDPKKAMTQICKDYSSDKICLVRSEFADMLLSCGLLYSGEKIKFIFSCIDINGGGSIDMGEFESFLFKEQDSNADAQRRILYHRMNAKNLALLGKREASKNILKSLSPHVKTGVAFHRFSSTVEEHSEETIASP